MSDIDPTQRGFVSYIDKSREYYLAKGYGKPLPLGVQPGRAVHTADQATR